MWYNPSTKNCIGSSDPLITSIQDHVDAFNPFLMDLKNIEEKVDDEVQALILFDNFVNRMPYGRDTT